MRRVGKHIAKYVGILASLVAMLALTAPAALAESPHFITASASIDSSGNLTVSWKEAGLGNNQLINYTASATGNATYVCVNGGGNHPSASNKETVTGPVSASGTFSSGKNGNIDESLTVSPPSAGSFNCPSGQSLELAEVSYTNVSIADTTNGITESIPGTFSTGCLLPNVRKAC